MRHVALAVIAVLAVAIGWWTLRAPTSPEMTMQLTPINGAAWAKYRAAAIGRTAPSGPLAEKTVAASAQVNALEARLGRAALKSPDYHRAVKRFRAAARAWIELEGPEAYVALGRHQGIALWSSLPAVLAAARTAGVAPGVIIETAASPPGVVEYIALGGGFLRFAESGGFIKGARRVDGMAALAQGLFMDHWLAPMRAETAVDGQLLPDERRWLHQWRVEYQRGGDADRKLSAIAALSRGASYPADHNAGVVLFRAGRYAEAAARFEMSAHGDAAALAAMARTASEGADELR